MHEAFRWGVTGTKALVIPSAFEPQVSHWQQADKPH